MSCRTYAWVVFFLLAPGLDCLFKAVLLKFRCAEDHLRVLVYRPVSPAPGTEAESGGLAFKQAHPSDSHARDLDPRLGKTHWWVESSIFIYFLLLILEGGRERTLDLLSHLFMHSLVDSRVCPEQGSNPRPWHIEATGNALTNWATQPGQGWSPLKWKRILRRKVYVDERRKHWGLCRVMEKFIMERPANTQSRF